MTVPAKTGAGVKAMRGTRTKAERALDLHETEREAFDALIDQWPEFFRGSPRRILEPSCGPGAMVSWLQELGHSVVATDIANYEDRWRGHNHTPRYWGRDWLSWAPGDRFIGEIDAVVMNPPYMFSDLHVWHALKFAPRVFALLELPWLAGTARECPLRARMLDGGHLAAFHPFRNRLKMHADNYTGPKNKNARLHCWFVLDREPSFAMASVMRRVTAARKGNAHG